MFGSVAQTCACPRPPRVPVPTSVATAARISAAANKKPKTSVVVSSGSVSFRLPVVMSCPPPPAHLQPVHRTVLIEKRYYRITISLSTVMPVAGTCPEPAHHHHRATGPITGDRSSEPAHRVGSAGRVRCRGHTPVLHAPSRRSG